MVEGFGYVFGQVALLLAAATTLGIALGRYLWPRRRTAPSDPPHPVPDARARTGHDRTPHSNRAVTAGPLAGFGLAAPARDVVPTGDFVSAGGLGSTAGASAPATGPLAPPPDPVDPHTTGLLADARARTAYTEARLTQAEARVAELETRLADSQDDLRQLRRQLGQADAEVVRLRLEARDLVDRNEAEMGRLESGAIAALESTIASHREQVVHVEDQLRAAQAAAEEQHQELAVERRRSAQLQAALAERDQHIADLMSERQQEERLASPDGGAGR